MTTLAQNLKRLRAQLGFSQQALSQKAGISRVAYANLESGKSQAKPQTLMSLADALSVKVRDLVVEVPSLTHIRFRSHKKLNSRQSVIFQVSECLKNYHQLEEILGDRQAGIKFPKSSDPRKAARLTREAFGLGKEEPIVDICGLLEHYGIKVLPLSIASTDFFGMSVGQKDGGPCVVVNCFERISVERWIFSAAHELGHLVLHHQNFSSEYQEEDQVEEDEANFFASEFLMPEEAFQKAWEHAKGLDPIARVIKVKHQFHVSYKTILMRLCQKGVKDVWKKFNLIYKHSTGQSLKRTEEIEGHGPEVFAKTMRADEIYTMSQHDFGPSRLGRLVRSALDQELISMDYAAHILKKPVEDIQRLAISWREEESLELAQV